MKKGQRGGVGMKNGANKGHTHTKKLKQNVEG